MKYIIYICIFSLLLSIMTPFMFLESIDHSKDFTYLLENKKEYFDYMKSNALNFFIGFLGGTITLYLLNIKRKII